MTTATRALLLATLAAAGACGAPSPATRHDVMVVDAGRNVYRQSDFGIRTTYDAPRDSVFAALAQAYADVGITPDVVDTKESIVARKQILIPRVFNGTRASALFSCGETAVGTSIAESGELYASARSQIVGEFDHPVVMTLVEAFVVPGGGTSANALHCGSTGQIEARIAKQVLARLGKR